jgi:hypothetical protein
MAEFYAMNHGISGRYVCGADGVMRPEGECLLPETEAKPAAKAPTSTKETK